MIFTSGSTGKPKAVMIRHKSALNVVRLWTKYVPRWSLKRGAVGYARWSTTSIDFPHFRKLMVHLTIVLNPQTPCLIKHGLMFCFEHLFFTSSKVSFPAPLFGRPSKVGLTCEDRFAQVASMSWDVHVIEVYGTLAARATSVTCPDLIKKSGPDARRWLELRWIFQSCGCKC